MSTESRVALQNMKYHKRRNILIGIAVFLTTLLLLVIPSIGKGMMDAQYAAINKMYPSWHALFRGVNTETVEKLSVYHGISEYGLRSDAGYVQSDEADITMMYFDRTGLELYNMDLAKGKLPEAENEIVVSEGMLAQLGQSGDIGDSIQIPFQIYRGGELDFTQQQEFVISGFIEDSKSNNEQKAYTAFVSKKFLEKEVPDSDINYRFLFQVETNKNATSTDIEESVSNIAKQFGIMENDVRVNDDYLAANYVDPVMIPTIAGIMCVIVFAGIITIYSIYYVGMSAQIQEFGRLKAMGTTKRQLKKIILREGLLVACIAIPIGLMMGTIVIQVVFYLMLHTNQNEMMVVMQELMKNREISLIYPLIYLLTVVIALLTVCFALMKPMKMASRVSEIEAIRYQGNQTNTKKTSRKSYTDLGIFQIAKIYMIGNKKNTIITIGAMSMTGILVMVVASVLSCANPVNSANNSVLGQYEISNAIEMNNKEHPERQWKNVIQNNPLNDELISKIKEVDGILDAVAFQSIKVTCDQFNDEREEIAGIPEEYSEELMDGILSGSTNYEELKIGDKVIVDKNLLHWYPDIKVGDQLKIQILDGSENNEKEVTVAAIGDYSLGFTNFNYLLMASEGVAELCDANTNGVVHIFADKSYDPEVENALINLVSENELLQMETWKQNYDEWKSALEITNGACYVFLSVLGAICIMNMINTMIHNVHLRKKEIGMMQAIGMSDGQLTKLLQVEGLFYTLGTLVITIGVGSALGYPVFLWAKNAGAFNIREYHYPTAAALIVMLILFLIQITLAFVLSRSVKKESLIERVRYSE